MIKKLLALASFSFISLACMAQNGSIPLWTVAAAGDVFTSSDKSLEMSWTLGQTAIATVEKGGLMLTQGFHQGELTFVEKQTGLKDNTYTEATKLLDVSLFPNPVRTMFSVLLSASDAEAKTKTTIEIVDISGRLVRSEIAMLSPGQPYAVGVEQLQPGVYLVRLRTADKARVVKMVKE